MAEVVKVVTGIDEKKWDFVTMTNKVKKNCGTFTEITVKTLIDKCNVRINKSPQKIDLIVRDKFHKNHLFDTSNIQLTANQGTLFQVASNFNCFETPNKRTNIYSGQYLSNLINDPTQGPAASGGALYGALYRLILNKRKPINLLSFTGMNPINGKLEHKEILKLPSPSCIKVGFQANTLACIDTTKKGMSKISSVTNLINQVFCSTVILRHDGLDNETKSRLSRPFLRAAYIGTYCVAATNSLTDICLTLIGGGSFKNPIETIIEEIITTHRKYSQYLQPGTNITLPVYMPNSCIPSVIRSLNGEDVFNVISV